jgi:hypothetical protein
MEKQHTLKILNGLANGINPATGERFNADSPYQHPDIVRALFDAVRALEGNPAPAATPERKAPGLPGNAGARWTTEEEERLTAAFDSGKTVAELARLLNRTLAGVEARLLKLGKIEASSLTAQLRYPAKGARPPSKAVN